MLKKKSICLFYMKFAKASERDYLTMHLSKYFPHHFCCFGVVVTLVENAQRLYLLVGGKSNGKCKNTRFSVCLRLPAGVIILLCQC